MNRTEPTIDQPCALPPETAIGAVSLTVADLARSEAFYRDVLGFTAMGRDGDTLTLGAGDSVPLLHLTERRGAPPKPRRATGLYHFAILVPTRRDLGRSLRRLLEQGQPVPGSADHLVSEALYLNDPDGNGIEIYRDRPRSAWKRDEGSVRMAVDPLDLRGLLEEAEADDAPWAGLPRGTTIGHIHLQVGDLPAARAFYHDLLCFDVATDALPGALFVSAGGYHHHIGLNVWAGVGAPAAPPGSVGLRRFAVILPDQAVRDRLAARISAAGVAVSPEEDGLLVRDPFGNALILQNAFA